jgi:pimeloyl-ACP methyl ester carboxylesterase
MHVAKWFAVAAASLLSTGFLYQAISGWFDRRRFVRDGRFIFLANGSRIYVREAGAGSPAVVFEAGIGASSLNWRHVQERMAGLTGTLAYDRAGLGWSGPRHSPRTPSGVAEELHELLQRAGVRPPLILVGHSFGGLVVRKYALLYPGEVAGLVLVDPMRCEEYPPYNPEMARKLLAGRRLCAGAVPVARFGLARVGLGSLICGSGKVAAKLSSIAGENTRYVLGRIDGEIGKLPLETRPMLVALWSRPAFYAEMGAYLKDIPDIVKQMSDAAPIGDIPVTVLTPGRSAPLTEECLRGIGERARQIVVPDCEHWIHLDRPELVAGAIRELLEGCGAAEPASASR